MEHISSSKNKRCIVLYPNSGEEWDAINNDWISGSGTTSTPESFSNKMMECIDIVYSTWNQLHKDKSNSRTNDVNKVIPPRMIVGGCCRTSPDTICALREKINTFLSNKME